MNAPPAIAISRLRSRAPAPQPIIARLVVEALTGEVAEALPALPPQSVLVLRRLALSVPGLDLARLPDAVVRARAARAAHELIADAYAQASRPARGEVSDQAPAVLFGDEAELLACMARDALAGRLDCWWWRAVLGTRYPSWRLAWQERAEAAPGALRLLARIELEASVIAALGESPRPNDANEQAPPFPARHRPEARLATAPPSVGAAPVELDGASPDAAAAVERIDAVAAAEPPPDSESGRPPLATLPHAGTAGAEIRISGEATPRVATGGTAADVLKQEAGTPRFGRRATRDSAQLDTEPGMHRSATIGPESSRVTDRPAPRNVATVRPQTTGQDRVTCDARDLGMPIWRVDVVRPPHRLPAEVARLGAPHNPERATWSGLATRPDAFPRTHAFLGNEPPVAAHGMSSAEAPAAAFSLDATPLSLESTPQALFSRHARLLFLVNMLLGDGLYPDFTRPADPVFPVPIWRLLALLGTGLAGSALRQDPLWALLDRLAADLPIGEDCLFDREWPIPGAAQALPLRRLRRARSHGFARWFANYLRSVRVRLAQALGMSPALVGRALVQSHGQAKLWVSEAEIVVVHDLEAHPVEWRLAGLDRDPGYLPGAGRRLRFVFS